MAHDAAQEEGFTEATSLQEYIKDFEELRGTFQINNGNVLSDTILECHGGLERPIIANGETLISDSMVKVVDTKNVSATAKRFSCERAEFQDIFFQHIFLP
ncbi:hypothetical protein ACJX0J_024811 [Zea mays]